MIRSQNKTGSPWSKTHHHHTFWLICLLHPCSTRVRFHRTLWRLCHWRHRRSPAAAKRRCTCRLKSEHVLMTRSVTLATGVWAGGSAVDWTPLKCFWKNGIFGLFSFIHTVCVFTDMFWPFDPFGCWECWIFESRSPRMSLLIRR